MERCTHKFTVDSKNVGTCSLCGEVRQFPPDGQGTVTILKEGKPGSRKTKKKRRAEPTNVHARSRFYEDNRNAITADLLSLGKLNTMRKWRIPRGTIPKLIRRWLTPEQAAIACGYPLETEAPGSPAATSGNGRFPAFPEFSNTWDAAVQVKWLEVYEKMAPEVHKGE